MADNNDQMSQVTVEQLKIMSDTIRVSTERLDQAFQFFREQAQEMGVERERYGAMADQLFVVMEGFKESLSNLDQGIEDLTSNTLALSQVVLLMQQKERGEA